MPDPIDLTKLSDAELDSMLKQQSPAAPTPDLSKLSDEDLQAQAPVKPAYGSSIDDVLKGMSPQEQDDALKYPDVAAQLQQRHAQFVQDTTNGVDALKSDNFDLWRWQNRMRDKPGFWATLGHAAVGVGKGAAAAAEQVDELAMKSMVGMTKEASQQAADLGAVSAAKALSFNNSLVRDSGAWAHSLLTSIQKIGADPGTRAKFDEVNDRFLFEVEKANAADDETADSIHQNAVTAVQALAPAGAIPALSSAAKFLGHTEVDKEASGFLSMLPTMVTEAGIARAASVVGASGSAAIAGARSSALRAGADALAESRTALAQAKTAFSAAVGVGDSEAMRDAKIWMDTEAANVATKESAMTGLARKAQEATEAAKAQAGQVGTARDATGAVMSKVGGAIAAAGRVAEKIQGIPGAIGKRLAPDSEIISNAVAHATESATAAGVGYALGDSEGAAAGAASGLLFGGSLGKLGAHGLQVAGEDAIRLGKLFQAGEATLPFWRNVRMAENVSGFTKQIGAFLDNSVVEAGSRTMSAAATGAIHAALFGAGLGVLTNPGDPVSGLAGGIGSGAALGLAMGAFGQWRSYANEFQIAKEQAGQLRVYQDSLAARPEELKAFNSLPEHTQNAISNSMMARPDLKIRYINDAAREPASYDSKALPDEVTVNLAAKDPLQDLVGHEIGHYVANHSLGSMVERKLLGDADAGIPGEYSARDANGEPILETSATGKKSYKVNPEFEAMTSRYVDALKATGQRRGWSDAKLQGEIDRVSDPRYIAQEIFAEQHLDYLGSDQFRMDAKGMKSGNDIVVNNAFLKNTLGVLGVKFRGDGKVVSPLVGEFKGSDSVKNMIRDYTRRQASGKSGDVEFEGGNTVIDEQALTKSSGYAERYFNASGDIVRDTNGQPVYDANGKAALKPPAVVEKEAKEVGKAIRAVLDDLAKSGTRHTDEVQKRTTADGRTMYSGRWLPDEAIDAIAKANKWNQVQIDNIRQINGELRAGLGMEWNHFYQAATKKGGGNVARSLAGRWRTDLPYGFQISAVDNLLVQSVSLEVLHDNAARAVAKGDAKLWNNDIGSVLKDARTYLENLAAERDGSTTIGTDKKNFLQNLLGIRVKGNGDVNPLHETTNAPKTVMTSLRIDRMNQVNHVSERNVPFSSAAQQRAGKNLSPDREAVVEEPKKAPAEEETSGQERTHPTETPEFKKWFGKSKVVDEDGKPLVVHHGTTSDFSVFKREAANPESDLGAGFYFSNTPKDVSSNYAGLGPDLTNKIEHRAEQLESNGNLSAEEALKKAKAEMMQHQGATMPVYLKLKNPAVIGGPKETFLDAEMDLDNDKFEGTFAKFVNGLKEHASEFHDTDDVEETASHLMEKFGYDGGGKLSDVWEAAKTHPGIMYATDGEGHLVGTELLRRALESAGFDGIIDHSVDEKFGSQRRIGKQMEGMDENTTHYVAFQPEQIKSAIGNNGKFNPKNPDIRFSPERSVSTVPIMDGSEKLELGERPSTMEIGRALADRARKAQRIPFDSRTEGAKDKIATALADEIQHAVKQDKSAIGWYERKINEAMDIIHQVHPELKDDENRSTLFKAILAITSNGQAVTDNFARANKLYNDWKTDGRIPTEDTWGGKTAGSINLGLSKLQQLVDGVGLEGTRQYLTKEFRFGDLKKLAKDELGIDLGSSEQADHRVWGSAIFGPKVGGGFFPNLNGNFTPVTMDLWLMRTWNRINGSLGQKDPEGMGRALARLREAAAANPTHPDAEKVAKLSDRALGNWAEDRYADWKNRRKFKDADAFDRPAKGFSESKEGDNSAPRGANERTFVRETFAKIDEKLAERGLPPINNADKQALLWYYGKDLYTALGYTTTKGKPADYADAARALLATPQ